MPILEWKTLHRVIVDEEYETPEKAKEIAKEILEQTGASTYTEEVRVLK